MGFPGGSDVKKSACHAGNLGLIPELGRSPGEVRSNPHQYSCLENPMDREVWWGSNESDTTKQLTLLTISVSRIKQISLHVSGFHPIS